MIGKLIPLILVPRYTSYMGATSDTPGEGTTDYVSAPIEVNAYASGSITAWRGHLAGTSSPTFKLYVQASTDGVAWKDLHLTMTDPWVDPGEEQALTVTFSCDQRFIRARVALGGTDPAVTCWATGFLVDRVDG